MSSALYDDILRWDEHYHCGLAKLHGHAVKIEVAPVLCGQPCDVDYRPEVGVALIREPYGGWHDMTHAQMVEAERILHDLVPE
jgi:hypothetical protein